MRLMQRHLYKALQQHERVVALYKAKYSRDTPRDWRTYEQRLALRIKTAALELQPLIEEAASSITVVKSRRGRPEVPVTKKVMVLLLKDIFQLSNRKMANFLAFFTALTGIDLGYKSVERVYSNELARMIIHNLYLLLVEKKGFTHADTTGDGTGHSLTITKHYRTEREKALKVQSAQKPVKKGGRLFAFSFALADLRSGMYIGYGVSMKSEQEAFHKAMQMAGETEVSLDSVRLDKLYSYQSITSSFSKDTAIYIIPKCNATIRGSPEWKRIMRSYVNDPIAHLHEYYLRNHSESNFSADKRSNGWKVGQKRDDRIETSLLCRGLWHNLLLLG